MMHHISVVGHTKKGPNSSHKNTSEDDDYEGYVRLAINYIYTYMFTKEGILQYEFHLEC